MSRKKESKQLLITVKANDLKLGVVIKSIVGLCNNLATLVGVDVDVKEFSDA